MITLKNVKYAAFASEETHCFNATVYVDGKKAGTAENSGHGGPTDVHWTNNELKEKAEKWIATLPAITYTFGECGGSYLQTDETVIDDLVTEWLIARDMKRALSKRILFTKNGKDGIFQSKSLPKQVKAEFMKPAKIAELKSKWGADKVLNLLPEAEALEIWKAA